ncbi:MAG TPA: PQQ-binding-like beta-propeller repeat protein [Candidatus Limnocylindrales bacterium]|nr:PQQ-binding-like beta-propeller repeat protein [Candidatus Limnocylindrales bacterium]
MEIAVIACALAACTSGPATLQPAGPGWPMFRGDLARDGHPPGATLDARGARRLGLAWRVKLDGAVDGTPAVAGGAVVVGSFGGTLAAIDAGTGSTLWTKRGLGAIADSPAIDGKRVYAGTLTGHVFAFDLSSGHQVWDWTAPPDAAVWASPVAYRDLVIVGVASPYGDTPLVAGRLYGLNATTGLIRWTACVEDGCAPGGGVWSTPAIDSTGTAFVGIGNPSDGVLAFDPMTGGRKWLSALYADQSRDLDVGASPVVLTLNGKEAVAQATVEGMFAVLDAATGSVLWSSELVAGTAVHGLIASPAYDGTSIYVGSASPPTGILALQPSDGAVVWRHGTDQPVYSAPAAGKDVIVFGTGAVFGELGSGSVIALSSADGQVLWSYDAHSAVRSGAAVSGDLVVIGDYRGEVLAFRPKP